MDINVLNKASLATYQDIRLKISFISQTGSEINSTKLTIYDFVQPNNTINHNEKIYLPEGTVNCKVSVLGSKY